MSFDFGLEGKTAIVTGCSSGLGERFARTLASQGVNVVCCARRKERLEELANSIREVGGSAIPVAVDVTDNAAIDRMFEQVAETCGGADILINNAGATGELKPFYEVDSADWQYLLNLNITAAFELSKRFVKPLLAANKGGSIVNISSMGGFRAAPMAAAYGASKAGLSQLTRAMAIELADQGIRVNSIAPGIVESEINTDEILQSPEGQYAISQIPLKRPGQPDNFDALILMLVSEASSFMTGEEIVVDGGSSVKLAGY